MDFDEVGAFGLTASLRCSRKTAASGHPRMQTRCILCERLKIPQCGLNISQPHDSPPLHTSPVCVTSPLFYSAASLPCSISPRFTLFVQKCTMQSHSNGDLPLTACWQTSQAQFLIILWQSGFHEEESFMQHKKCLRFCSGCTVQPLSCLGFGLGRVPFGVTWRRSAAIRINGGHLTRDHPLAEEP